MADPAAPSWAVPVTLAPATLQQESGGYNPANVPTSLTGAIGPGQIEPSTWAQYAYSGEKIDNATDNALVSRRIVADLWNRTHDPARVAVGYVSGLGNIAPPDSPLPWKQDVSVGVGDKTVSDYTNEYLDRVFNPISEAQAQGIPDWAKPVQAAPTAAAGVPDWAQAPAPKEPGVIGALTGAFGLGAREQLRGAEATATGPFKEQQPPQEAPNAALQRLLNEPISLKALLDPSWYTAKIGYGLGSVSAPIAGAVLGAAGTSAVLGPEAAPVGGIIGAMGADAFTNLGLNYQRARAEGLSHEQAVDRAWIETGIGSTVTGMMQAVPGVGPLLGKWAEGTAKRAAAEALANVFAVQPAIGAAGQVATAAVEGKPLTAQDLAAGYVTNVGMGLPFEGVRALRGARPEGAPPPVVPPPEGRPPEEAPAAPAPAPEVPLGARVPEVPIAEAPAPGAAPRVAPEVRPEAAPPTAAAVEPVRAPTEAPAPTVIDRNMITQQHGMPDGSINLDAARAFMRAQVQDALGKNQDVKLYADNKEPVNITGTKAGSIVDDKGGEHSLSDLLYQKSDNAYNRIEITPKPIGWTHGNRAIQLTGDEITDSSDGRIYSYVRPQDGGSPFFVPKDEVAPVYAGVAPPRPEVLVPPGATAGPEAPPTAAGAEAPLAGTGPLRPISGTGEERTRQLAASMEAAAINRGLVDTFGELPTYNRAPNVDQGAAALALLRSDPARALAVARGQGPAPEGVLPEAVLEAVFRDAQARKDWELARELGTRSGLLGEATTMGQRIQYLSNIAADISNPLSAIKSVQNAMDKAPGATTKLQADLRAATAASGKARSGRQSWVDFINQLRC